MARKREIATAFDNQPNTRRVASSEQRPENIYEALMQCAPGQDPDTPRDTLLLLRDTIQDAIDKLEPREQWIFDALVTRRLSIRQCARELGLSKTHVHRELGAITAKLREILSDNEEIRRHLR